MANTFLKPEVIARTALGLLEREIVLPRLVWSFGQADFRGAKDDTITLRLPAVLEARDYEWRTRGSAITIDDLTETGVDVSLDTHPYSAVAITDEQLTLDIVSFADQVLGPQVRAVAERLENLIASTLVGASVPAGNEVAWDDSDPLASVLAARKALNDNNVPMADRALVLGSQLEIDLLGSDNLLRVDASGSDSALRDAMIGRLAGFTVVTSNALSPGVGFAIHRTAVAFGNVAPVVPDGATAGASETYAGLSMRWIRDYDPNYLRDRSVVSCFAGATSVEDGGSENVRMVTFTGGS